MPLFQQRDVGTEAVVLMAQDPIEVRRVLAVHMPK